MKRYIDCGNYVDVEKITEKAILINTQKERQIWIPKSQIIIVYNFNNTIRTLLIPEWLIYKNSKDFGYIGQEPKTLEFIIKESKSDFEIKESWNKNEYYRLELNNKILFNSDEYKKINWIE